MIRAVAVAVLGALASAAWLALFYTGGGGLRVDFAVDPPRALTGFYRAERDNATGLTFAWTAEEASVRLPGLDRRVEWTLTVRLRGANPSASAHPEVTFFVDGVQVRAHQTSHEFGDVRLQVPANPSRRGAAILIRSSTTFVPGAGDPRQLGVMVDSLELRPAGLVLPPAEIFGPAMIGGAALGAGVASLGVTAGAAIGSAVLLGAAQGATLAYGFGPYTSFPQTVLTLALVTAGVLAVTAWVASWRVQPLRNTAKFAIAFSAGAAFLKLLVLLHPNMPIGDALFHAHRFQRVVAGNLYFTSVAPGGYAFPYAPGLYVAAAPLAGLVRREMGDVVLLRVVTVAAEAAAALLLYSATVRAWHDRLAGAIAVAMFHLIPLTFRVVTVGNLTNAFAQAFSIPALWLMTLPAVPFAALTIVLTAAFLSHTSTFAILSVSALASAGLFAWAGTREHRGAARTVAVASLVAIVLAVVLYYAHFMDTYRTELARLGSETAAAAPDAGGRGTAQRAFDVPRLLPLYFGVPVLVLAAAGAVRLWSSEAHDRLRLTIGGWTIACGAFMLLGIITPLDMRYYLALIPALALLAAAGASWWWGVHGAGRGAALVLLGWIVWRGVGTWWETLQR